MVSWRQYFEYGPLNQVTEANLKSRYRKLALRLHPNKRPNQYNQATAEFKVLGDMFEQALRGIGRAPSPVRRNKSPPRRYYSPPMPRPQPPPPRREPSPNRQNTRYAPSLPSAMDILAPLREAMTTRARAKGGPATVVRVASDDMHVYVEITGVRVLQIRLIVNVKRVRLVFSAKSKAYVTPTAFGPAFVMQPIKQVSTEPTVAKPAGVTAMYMKATKEAMKNAVLLYNADPVSAA